MKKIFFLILTVLINSAVNSQQVIRITPDLELVKISANAYLHVSYVDLE